MLDSLQKELKLRHVIYISIILRLITLLALYTLRKLVNAFDTSHILVDEGLNASATLRWDAVHFASIAIRGYENEQQFAFSPTWLYIMRISGKIIAFLRGGEDLSAGDVALGGALVNIGVSAGATVMLYHLTRAFYHERFAIITSLLYTLAPAPAALASAYTEPTYALFTFTGFYLLPQHRNKSAVISLAVATSIRSTGVFAYLVVFLGIISLGCPYPGSPFVRLSNVFRKASYSSFLASWVLLPWMGFQHYAHINFCLPKAKATRPWCKATPPSIYFYVQKEYWGNGLFNYWTPAQIPNFVIALPILIPSIWGSWIYLDSRIFKLLPRSSSLGLAGMLKIPFKALEGKDGLMMVLHLHHLLLTALLIFGSHIQISLRLAATDPVIWWNITSLMFDWSRSSAPPLSDHGANEKVRMKSGRVSMRGGGASGNMTRFGRLWIWWTVIWGSVSIVLWSSHLPPA